MSRLLVVTFVVCAGLVSASAQDILLPGNSNVYPDTFAICWRFEPPRQTVPPEKGEFTTLFEGADGDNLLKVETLDTLAVSPYYPEYVGQKGLAVSSGYQTEEKFSPNQWEGHCYLKTIPENDKIEALISLKDTRYNTTNLLLLAKAYEEAKCISNAYYIYMRIRSLNTEEGNAAWEKFYRRLPMPRYDLPRNR